MPVGPSAQLSRLLKRFTIVSTREATACGIPRSYLQRAVERGELERVARGVYRSVAGEPSVHHGLVEAVKRVPAASVSLLSALQFHRLTTELPHQVWLLLDRTQRAPKVDDLPVRIVRASGVARRHGLSVHRIEGVRVTITTPAKTVADCFRYRRHVGLDVALTALREYVRRYPAGTDELVRAARADRILTFMRPYLEALV